jgi:hypothetical protein
MRKAKAVAGARTCRVSVLRRCAAAQVGRGHHSDQRYCLSNGKDDMQFHDPGNNRPYYFKFKSGTVSFTDTTDLKSGHNDIRIIVNNTGNGINGHIEPVNEGNPSYFGIVATASYTP